MNRPNHPYIYELTDKENGKKYLGCQWGKKAHPEDLGVRYFTGSLVVQPLFRSNPNRFERKILLIGPSDFVREMERKLQRSLECAARKDYYNLCNSYPRLETRMMGSYAAGSANAKSGWTAEMGRKYGAVNGQRLREITQDIEHQKRAGKIRGAVLVSSGHVARMWKIRRKCEVCGLESTGRGIQIHQERSRHEGIIKL